jgi:uncharacterized protein
VSRGQRGARGRKVERVTEPRYPGVYIEEIDIQTHSIEGVSTSTTGFIGEAPAGPMGQAQRVTSFAEFERVFGGLRQDAELGYSVMSFFANGGRDAWVVRVDKSGTAADSIDAFDTVDPLNLLCLPGVADEQGLMTAVSYCDRRKAFLVADSPTDEVRQAVELAERMRATRSPNAAVYFPRVEVSDPLAAGSRRSCAPSGSVAGVMARTDHERGVWVTPAGVEAKLLDVVGVDVAVPDHEAESLAAAGVNPIRSIGGAGVVVWGGRTIAQDGEWKYVSVRRLALFLEESLSRGLQWAVNKPNGPPLWIQVRQSAANFLSDLWRKGALQGATWAEAFLVECDRSTMTQNDIDEGRLVALIGIAPTRPAEFVLFQIGLWTHKPP